MTSIKVSAKSKIINGKVKLTGSKSIANRVLLIRALAGEEFQIENMSESDDSKTMIKLLGSNDGVLDAHHAGTTFRFLTAYLAIKGENKVLTGSERMKQRPIGPLVDALNKLGANISYLEKEGYPPLKISTPLSEFGQEVSVPGDISSQYLSALLMIAPMLPNGLKLNILGDLVSKPYLEMTLSIMAYFGIVHDWTDDVIAISPQSYVSKPYFVEADWSAASYYYSIAAFSEEAHITLEGLGDNSLQGDSAIVQIATQFGVTTTYGENCVILERKKDSQISPFIEYDFIKQPDIAQTIFVMCAGTGVSGMFTGLQTLYIKETDRIKACQKELAKVNIFLTKIPPRFKKNTEGEYFMIEGKADLTTTPAFDTYHDHRMAMAFAPLALLGDVIVNDCEVVSKSYPEYWEDLESLGLVGIRK
jgi:3-phosphoshikimate 1-carboxyvinyltransferase